MSKIIHLSFSVKGALQNMSKADMKRLAPSVSVDGVPLRTADEMKNFLLNELAQGHELLPMGDCDNFDWKTGCRGHEKDGEHDA